MHTIIQVYTYTLYLNIRLEIFEQSNKTITGQQKIEKLDYNNNYHYKRVPIVGSPLDPSEFFFIIINRHEIVFCALNKTQKGRNESSYQ